MVEEFLTSLIKTNRSHLFFVDWDKAKNYRDLYKDELALLSVLTNTKKTPQEELTRLIKNYPKINSLIPLLVACRIKNSNNSTAAQLTVLDENEIANIEYKFSNNNLTEYDINETVRFTEKTGLLNELVKINNHTDYYFGIEVGMDTNARKNRSGSAMEMLVEKYIEDLSKKNNGVYLKQCNFEKASNIFGVKTPPHQANKKGDFMLLIKGKPWNVEVNYFDGSGSKQEIMNSYIPRAEDIKKYGWGFILITDGPGWIGGRRQLEEGFERIKNIFNIQMCRNGRLGEIL